MAEISKSEKTKKKILEAGLKLYPDITARAIAREVEITHPLVSHYFGESIKDAVAEYAVKVGNSRVIAQLIAVKHKAIKKLSAAERKRHMNAVSQKQ